MFAAVRMRALGAVLLLVVSCGPQAKSQVAGGIDEGVDSGTPSPFAYRVTVEDPSNLLPNDHAAMLACTQGALDEWGKYVTGKGVLLVEVLVEATRDGRMTGNSTSNVPIGSCKNTRGCTLVREQAINRLLVGKANPAKPGEPDVRVTIDPNYWLSVWVDPDPQGRTATVPENMLDCVSVVTHEIAHGLGINGFRSRETFEPTSAFQTNFDDLIHLVPGGSALTFEGPRTKADFGSLPLTRTSPTQNVYHYGDATTPSDIDTLLMNGIAYDPGHRYRVQKLDVRVMQDLGLPVYQVPSN